jgi:hypothetical protein
MTTVFVFNRQNNNWKFIFQKKEKRTIEKFIYTSTWSINSDHDIRFNNFWEVLCGAKEYKHDWIRIHVGSAFIVFK